MNEATLLSVSFTEETRDEITHTCYIPGLFTITEKLLQ